MLHVEDKESVLDGRRLRFVAHGGHALLARRCDEVTRGANLEEIARISTEEKARDDAAVRACQEERHRVLSVSQTLECCPKWGRRRRIKSPTPRRIVSISVRRAPRAPGGRPLPRRCDRPSPTHRQPWPLTPPPPARG